MCQYNYVKDLQEKATEQFAISLFFKYVFGYLIHKDITSVSCNISTIFFYSDYNLKKLYQVYDSFSLASRPVVGKQT